MSADAILGAQMVHIYDAISHASKDLLESVIEQVCMESAEARGLVMEKLLLASDFAPDVPSENEDEKGSGDSKKTTTQKKDTNKRIRTRYAKCKNCKEEFDIIKNTATSCSYHPDSPEPIEDAFADDHAYTYGIGDWDEEAMFDEFPESFQFPCCEEDGEAKGCVTDWHREESSKKKRVG